VRKVTDPLLESVRVPVLSGVNQGRWWSLASAGSGYGTGLRARRQMMLIAELLRPRDVVWDVGAHHGFVTLCAARHAREVHAFEPSARNRAVLRRHVRWNAMSNVHVHPYALGDRDGTARFGGNGTSKTFALHCGEELVDVRRAATLVATRACAAPTFMKIDVEGAEAEVLSGVLEVLPSSARLLIAVHGPAADEHCTSLLERAGFEIIPSAALRASREGPWNADPDAFCIGPGVADRDVYVERLRAAGF
jgi:FkbM family methyltransferase